MTDSTQKWAFDAPTLQTPPEGVLAAIERAGKDAAALVEAWVATENTAAVVEAAETASGAARKAARRGLNVLKARRIPIPERPHVSKLITPEAETVKAWLLPPDTNGTILLALAAHSASRRYRTVFVFLHDGLGVHRVDNGSLSQSQLKESLRQAAPDKSLRAVEVPVEWARYRIAEARRRHVERRVPEPLGFASAASLLEPIPAMAPPHPFDEEGLVLDDEDAKEIAQRSSELHRVEEFRGWLPGREAVDELLKEVGKHLNPGEQPAPESLRDQLSDQVLAATDRYFSPERRAALVRAMKDAGLGVLARLGEQKALEVVAAIKVIENRGLITDPPHEVGFLRSFFEKAISVLAQQGGGSLRIPVPRSAAAAQAEQMGSGSTESHEHDGAGTESASATSEDPQGEEQRVNVDSIPAATAAIDAEWEPTNETST